MIAALLSAWPLVRRCDQRRGLPAVIGTFVGLVSLAIQHHEAAGWEWMLYQPDQKATLKVLHRVGWLARQEGIPRSQLVRVFDPCFRSWNGSILHDHPDTFHLMELAAAAPVSVENPLPDPVARRQILAHLNRYERTVLGAGACVSLNPPRLSAGAKTAAVARRVEMHHADKIDRGRYHGANGDSYIEFEFDPAPQARFLFLPGLQADQDVLILRTDEKGRWRRPKRTLARPSRAHRRRGHRRPTPDSLAAHSDLAHQNPVHPSRRDRPVRAASAPALSVCVNGKAEGMSVGL